MCASVCVVCCVLCAVCCVLHKKERERVGFVCVLEGGAGIIQMMK